MTNNNMIFIANWKMNGEKSHISGINKTIKFLKKSKNKKNQIIYCPPFTLISSVKNNFETVAVISFSGNLGFINFQNKSKNIEQRAVVLRKLVASNP